jgi:methylated-DNA-[protein]-cysteine S-methyltransferase
MENIKHSSRAYVDGLPESPLGVIWAAVSERGLVAVQVGSSREDFVESLRRLGFTDLVFDSPRAASFLGEIAAYLEGRRQDFDLPIDWSVLTPFQQQVLRATCAIPYGQVTTYGDLARQLGKPRAARAVGRAQATNPMPLVIPCHRVVGADGGLHGYGAGEGLSTKTWLLNLEGSSID